MTSAPKSARYRPGSRAGDDRGELDDADARERTGSRVHHASPTGRSGRSTARVNVHTFAWSWLKPSVRTVSTPCPGRDRGAARRQHLRLAVERVAVEQRRQVAQLAEAEIGDGPPGNVGHAHAEQQGVDEGADDDVAAVLAFRPPRSGDRHAAGSPPRVSRQNIWSSASVMVWPGQCRNTSPGSYSSRYRPKCCCLESMDARHLRPRAPGSARRSALPRRP